MSDRTPVGRRLLVSDRTPVGRRLLVSDRTPVGRRLLVSDRTPVGRRLLVSDRTPVGRRDLRVGDFIEDFGILTGDLDLFFFGLFLVRIGTLGEQVVLVLGDVDGRVSIGDLST